MRVGGHAGGAGQRQLARARDLRPDALGAQQREYGHEGRGLHGEGVQHGGVGDGGESGPQRGGRGADAGHVEEGGDRLRLAEKALLHCRSYGLIPAVERHVGQPIIRAAAPQLLTKTIQSLRM